MQSWFGRFSAHFSGATLPSGSVAPVTSPQTAPQAPREPLAVRLWEHWATRSSPQLLGEERTQDLLVIGACAAFSLIGWLMVMQGYQQLQHARAVERWPTTTGAIIAVDVQTVDSREGARWRPQVTYTYTVQRRAITATRIAAGKAPSIDKEEQARAYVRKYLPQTPVTVYYNPSEITDSVLDPAIPPRAYLNLALGAAFACLGSALLLLIGLPGARRRARPQGPL